MTNLTLSEMKVPVLPDYITHCHSYSACAVQFSSVQFTGSKVLCFSAKEETSQNDHLTVCSA